MWLKIAARNLLKNRRRSMFTVLAIALGFAAVNIFGGYMTYVFENLQESFIYGQGSGHITIFKQGFREEGKLDPSSFLITKDEYEKVKYLTRDIPDVSMVTAQLHVTGLISNGQASTIFIGLGRIASDFYAIRGKARGIISNLKNFQGERVRDDRPGGVGLSLGLSKQLHLPLDSEGIVTAPTVDGYINALDFEVVQLFEGASETLNEQLVLGPLSFVQSLYDTDSVGQVNILLEDITATSEVMSLLNDRFQEHGLPLEILSWDQLSPFYVKVRDMLYVIFTFVFVIVFLIASMSVVNTMGMAVMERITEIGTLRALGASRKLVTRLFFLESGLLGTVGVVFGLLLTLFIWWLIYFLEITWLPPMFTIRVPLEVYLVPTYLIVTSVVFIALAVLSAIPPVRRASRRGIVDALGHT